MALFAAEPSAPEGWLPAPVRAGVFQQGSPLGGSTGSLRTCDLGKASLMRWMGVSERQPEGMTPKPLARTLPFGATRSYVLHDRGGFWLVIGDRRQGVNGWQIQLPGMRAFDPDE